MTTSPMHKALTISASDSGGGSGIQADLKTFAAFGVYGLSVVTGVMAQNTQEVAAIAEVPDEVVIAELDTVLPDIGAESIKTGMLGAKSIVENVVDRVEAWGYQHLVVDPVMISANGAPLLHPDALAPLKSELFRMASVLTPTIAEAEVLVGRQIATPAHAQQAAKMLAAMGPETIVLKGFADGDNHRVLVWQNGSLDARESLGVNYASGYGTGCTLSASITALLATGADIDAALERALRYVATCVENAMTLGDGEAILRHDPA